MPIVLEIAIIFSIIGSIVFASWSVSRIKEASKKPCNGELKQLAHLDHTIAKFHRVIKQHNKPTGSMHHIQHG